MRWTDQAGVRPALDLNPAASALAGLVEGTRDRDLANPTPCTAWTVADLLTHIRGFAAASTAAALRRPFHQDAAELVEPLAGDWRVNLPDRLVRMAGAWADPNAWKGDTEAAGIRSSAVAAGNVGLQELLLHGWDLARATGQPFTPDPASVAACLTFVSSLSEDERSALFAGHTSVSAEATPFARLLALTGRSA